VYFGMKGVYCLSLKGELLWEKDLGAYPTQNDWGTGSSPVVRKELLYVQVDNEEQSFLVALDKETGDEVWRADREEGTNYSTPYLWKSRDRTELVTGGKTARSYDPETGELLWKLRMDGHYNIPSPVGDRDYLYMGNPGRGETPGTLCCVRAGATGDITPAEGETSSSGVVWYNPDAPAANPSPLLYEGLLYLVSSRGGEVTCFNAFSGEQVYREKIEGVAACWASPWVHRGKIFFTDEKGVTRVFRAGRHFELLEENSLDDKFWSSVAVAGSDYIFKGSKKLYCIGR
jgi:outer membrane protein assembly factor BamB